MNLSPDQIRDLPVADGLQYQAIYWRNKGFTIKPLMAGSVNVSRFL